MPPKFDKRRSWSAEKARKRSIDSMVAELRTFNTLRQQPDDWKRFHAHTIM